MLRRLSITMLLAAFCSTGCGDKGGDPPTATSSGPASSARYAPSAGSSGAAAAPSTDTPASPHAGTYKGTFKSKRGEVTVPEGVKYPTWNDDPGGFEGDNTVELEVAGDGLIQGKMSGALGNLRIKGLADADGFSFGVSPENASDQDGMTGVVSGKIEGSGMGAAMLGELRVSNASGAVVRAGSLSLKKAQNKAN